MSKALCYRCEHRAVYLETGGGPRSECKMSDTAVQSCYMYTPVRPVRLKLNEGDTRPPIAPAFISARLRREGILDGILAVTGYEDSSFVKYWKPADNGEVTE